MSLGEIRWDVLNSSGLIPWEKNILNSRLATERFLFAGGWVVVQLGLVGLFHQNKIKIGKRRVKVVSYWILKWS